MEVKDWIKEKLNNEKIKIIEQDGNVLVTANPGTGKTLLLTFKYLNLIENGTNPEDILCLTFTTKAKKELEDRLLKEIKERKLDVNPSNVRVYTFHSFALENGEEDNIVSSNLLRYAIYEFFKQKEILTYGDQYLLDTIVPKMENLLRYLKSYGISPEDVSIEEVKKFIEADKKNTKEEIDKFAEYFIETYKFYEEIKSSRGIDYSDMLLNFLNKKEVPVFKYVLVDEMQDVNQVEAKIALRCAKNFVAVGDKKQAIMGFQGGSVSNLKLFEDSEHFILSDNFRSGQEILDYAKDRFQSTDESNAAELENLKNANDEHCDKPIVYSVEKDKLFSSACELAKELSDNSNDDSQIAIVVRTNSQIAKITKELKARDLDFSSTYLSASKDAKQEIILFLKGILSNNPKEMKNALFSTFFPMKIQHAFNFCKLKEKEFLKSCFKLNEIRDEIKNLRDVDLLFEKYIIPVSVAYGSDYLLAALSVRESCKEAIRYLGEIDYKPLIDFISSADLMSQTIESKKKIVVTTVHKSKGLQYDSVIYLPKKTRDNSNFQDRVVECILKTKNIEVEEELQEEALRIDFVAFTRAKNNLYVMSADTQDYVSDFSETEGYSSDETVVSDLAEKSKKAFSLFVSGDYEEAKKHLEEDDSWIIALIKNHFENLDHISFTSLNTKPLDYLRRNILRLGAIGPALDLGHNVHLYAQSLLEDEAVDVEEEYKVYFENIKELIEEIKKNYPTIESVEQGFEYTVRDLFGVDSDFKFSGKLDAVFTDGENYLIVDWKTSRNDSNGGSYRQQLMAYKKAFSLIKGIPENKIKIAIGYVGLRANINLGVTDKKLDNAQPRATAIKTLTKKVEKIIEWKEDPDKYIEEFSCENTGDDKLWLAICEQMEKEKNGQCKKL
ncbi:ATP-dependent helicase [Candidatus Pacearchaeota archaeon]|nr:ATP-dependent helicase [Candidatus Pacearchaeota archaeon]